jgi:1-deoxy-D-xylulose-5-phosphate reductoisomerase
VAVHPQSIVHSMIEMVDGSILAQLGVTDMRLMIQYALTYPDRLPTDLPPLSLDKLSRLEFFEPDLNRFPCLGLAYDAMRRGQHGSRCTERRELSSGRGLPGPSDTVYGHPANNSRDDGGSRNPFGIQP